MHEDPCIAVKHNGSQLSESCDIFRNGRKLWQVLVPAALQALRAHMDAVNSPFAVPFAFGRHPWPCCRPGAVWPQPRSQTASHHFLQFEDVWSALVALCWHKHSGVQKGRTNAGLQLLLCVTNPRLHSVEGLSYSLKLPACFAHPSLAVIVRMATPSAILYPKQYRQAAPTRLWLKPRISSYFKLLRNHQFPQGLSSSHASVCLKL